MCCSPIEELEQVRCGREAATWLLWKEEASKAEQERGQQGWSRSQVDMGSGGNRVGHVLARF